MKLVTSLLLLILSMSVAIMSTGAYYSGKGSITREECPSPNTSLATTNWSIGVAMSVIASFSIFGIIMYMFLKRYYITDE